jgi:hypothetical protein
MMKKHRPRAMKEFMSVVFRQFGLQVIVLATFMDGREPSFSMWVIALYYIYAYFS